MLKESLTIYVRKHRYRTAKSATVALARAPTTLLPDALIYLSTTLIAGIEMNAQGNLQSFIVDTVAV